MGAVSALSVVEYNVEGSHVLWDNSVRNYLMGFNIIVLTETFLETFPNNLLDLFPNHTCYSCPSQVVNEAATARSSGGVAVFIDNALAQCVHEIKTDQDNMVILQFSKNLCGTDKSIIFKAVYIPPSNSVYYDIEPDIVNGVSMLESALLEITEHYPDCYICVTGDLNARTGNKNLKIYTTLKLR